MYGTGKITLTVEEEQERLRQAIDFTLLDLMTLTAKAEASGLDDIAAIFSGHHTLLDDPELLAAASELLQHEHCTAEYAWQQVLKELSQQYQQLDDEYLQARYIDVDDLLHRTLVHLTQTKNSRSLTRQLFYWRRTFIPPQYCNWIRRL